MERLAIPSLIIVNVTSMIHYMPPVASSDLTISLIHDFLISVKNKEASVSAIELCILQSYLYIFFRNLEEIATLSELIGCITTPNLH